MAGSAMADGIYEKREFDLLAKRMVRRDGYTLEHVGGAIVIKKLGRCDVRVVLRDSCAPGRARCQGAAPSTSGGFRGAPGGGRAVFAVHRQHRGRVLR